MRPGRQFLPQRIVAQGCHEPRHVGQGVHIAQAIDERHAAREDEGTTRSHRPRGAAVPGRGSGDRFSSPPAAAHRTLMASRVRTTSPYLTPLGIALLYALFGAAWILLSDRALTLFFPPAELARWQTLKGLLYVWVTAGGLYLLTRAGMSAIRRSERPYRQMFQTTTVALLVDPVTARVVDANAAASQFYGWSHEELVGRSVADINVLSLSQLLAHMRRVSDGEKEHFYFQHRTASGEVREVEVFSSAVDLAGRRLLYSIVYDLTQRLQAERALEASEARYRALMSEASDAFFISDAQHRLVDVNARACELTGYAEDQLLRMRMDDLMQPEDLTRLPLRVEELRAGHTVLQERRLIRKGGEVVHVEISAKMLEDGRIQAIARDVTERRRLEEQLRQSQKMEAIGQLTGGIAHDLNNVLSIVLANAELLRQGLPAGREDLQLDVAELQNSAKRGATMIRKLLSFSRNAPLEIVGLDLGEATSESINTLRRLLPAQIDVTLAVPDERVLVRADAGAVEQILINLVTNARDALSGGGNLHIEVRRRSLSADEPGGPAVYGCLVVRDDGAGMDEATRARIFEPFFTTKPPPLGTGLGMTMIYGLVKQQKGWIDVVSAPGEGTTVTVSFPAGDLTVPRPGTDAAAQHLPRGTETILIAEDEAPLRRAAARLLERLGYTVLAAADGQEALALFRAHSHEVSLVLSDIVMPRLGGRGLYEALRREGHNVKFLFSSGYGGEEIGELSGDTAMPPLLRKPWSVAELASRLRGVLDA
jgi:PAS domain S-box-containing protein